MNIREKLLESNKKYQAKVAALLQELSQYPEAALNKTPANGGWSAQQTAWHLLLVEEKSLQYVHKKLGFGGPFEAAGTGAAWRTFWLLVALRLPLKFKAPASSGGDGLPQHSSLQEISDRWLRIRAEWGEFMAQMPENLLDKAVFRHPRAGRMGWIQLLAFYHAHFDRHLLQIRRSLL